MTPTKRVLLLGADGFLGRHIAYALRARGIGVLCSARRVSRLAQMGFDVLKVDLTDPACHEPAFWKSHLATCTHVVNASGLLTGSDRQFGAVHADAPAAIYKAMPAGAGGVLISAIGIDADTNFARYRRMGEDIAEAHGITILRPGLVLADSAYGGSALARGLAACPFVIPVVARGEQRFNPIHADDLAAVIIACLQTPPAPGPHDIGGAQTVTQADLLRALRRWMGLEPAPILPMPAWVTKPVAFLGDVLRLGPISTTSLRQLEKGVEAGSTDWLNTLPGLASPPRGLSQFIATRPAGTHDLWHARLYLLRPALRIVLILLWLISGVLGLTLSATSFLPLISGDLLPDGSLVALARIGGLADLAIALALIRAWNLRLMGWIQIALIMGYMIAFSVLAPSLWLLPLGGLLKNLPLLALIGVFIILEEER